MPTISMFYGILIRMIFKDVEKHHAPHILKKEDLMADWALAVAGSPLQNIRGLE